MPLPAAVRTTLHTNGQEHVLDADPRTTLPDVLRNHIGLTGAKKGCDHGQCGACTGLVDGRRMNSCLLLPVAQSGAVITIIEGLGTPDGLHPVQETFLERDAYQCGYCTSGQICSAVGLIDEVRAGWRAMSPLTVVTVDIPVRVRRAFRRGRVDLKSGMIVVPADTGDVRRRHDCQCSAGALAVHRRHDDGPVDGPAREGSARRQLRRLRQPRFRDLPHRQPCRRRRTSKPNGSTRPTMTRHPRNSRGRHRRRARHPCSASCSIPGPPTLNAAALHPCGVTGVAIRHYGDAEPSARVNPLRPPPGFAALSGVATSSRDLPSASTARKNATRPPAIITAAPSR